MKRAYVFLALGLLVGCVGNTPPTTPEDKINGEQRLKASPKPTGDLSKLPTPTPTPSQGATTATPTPTPAGSKSPSPSPTPTGSTSPAASASPTASPTASPSGTPTPSPTPTPKALHKVTVAAVTGNVDGTDFKFGVGSNPSFGTAQANLGLASLMVMPDNTRLWAIDSQTGNPSLVKVDELLAKPGQVDGIFGVAFEGTTKLQMLAKVAGAATLVTVTITPGVPPTYAATEKAVTGAVPGSFAGHAVSGGSLYVASPGDNKVYKIDLSSGASTVFAGTGQALQPHTAGVGIAAANAQIIQPAGVAVVDDHLYVTETGANANRILKIKLGTDNLLNVAVGGSGAGKLLNGPLSTAFFNTPVSMVAEGKKLYVADRTNKTVREVDLELGWVSSFTTDAVEAQNGQGMIEFPRGLGRLGTNTYVIDGAGNVKKVTPQ